MEITTKDKLLSLLLTGDSKATKKFGTKRLNYLKQRLKSMQIAETLEGVRTAPGHFHELVDNRKGQWACDLDQPYRLIFEPHEDPIPTDSDGKFIWIEIKGVELIEVTNYHGK